MAPGDVVPDLAKQPKPKEKRPGSRTSKADCEPDGSFVFEAHDAWKDFHNSLRHFYDVGELCDVTLKVSDSVWMEQRFGSFICGPTDLCLRFVFIFFPRVYFIEVSLSAVSIRLNLELSVVGVFRLCYYSC